MSGRSLVALALLVGCGRAAPPAPRAEPSSPPAGPSSVSAAARGPSGARPRLVEAPADEAAAAIVRARRLEAKAEGRVLVVLVSATWCEPCKRFKAELAAGRLDATLGRTTLLVFDADRDAERLAAAGYTFRFVPFVALPGPTGEPAERLEATGQGSDAWRALLGTLERWQG